ncbi:MAG: hypothetical protein JW749_10740 [Sedimentisphaerales bacterium]|nr:hypothetical protein [Sedimentisphaerales bacterium]
MNNRNKKHGSIMVVILIIVIVMSIVGIGILCLGFHGRMMAIRSSTAIAARCAADAALADAVFHMNQKIKVKPWDNSTLPSASNVSLPGCNASFDYTVSQAGGDYIVQATGRSAKVVHAVDGFLRIQSVFDYALFARDAIELKNSATIDWINNQPGDSPLQVGTNSTNNGAIILKNGSNVKGDVVVGVGGDPLDVINGIENIEGRTYAMFYRAVLTPIVVPAWLVSMPSGGDIKNTTTISTSGKYDNIDLGNSETITITEPVSLYITESIDLGNSAGIIIGGSGDTDNDAALTIYLAGDLEGKNGAGINNLTADAKRFTLYGLDSCANIRLKNGNVFYGTLFAPNASVDMDNSVAAYGSVIGQNIGLKNGGIFYYDAALRDRTVNDEAVRFVVHRWAEH